MNILESSLEDIAVRAKLAGGRLTECVGEQIAVIGL